VQHAGSERAAGRGVPRAREGPDSVRTLYATKWVPEWYMDGVSHSPPAAQTRPSVGGPATRRPFSTAGKEAAREASEVAFQAGDEEGARALELGSSALSTDEEQRQKAPEAQPDSLRVQGKVLARADAGARAREESTTSTRGLSGTEASLGGF